jgi:hypothetical protein
VTIFLLVLAVVAVVVVWGLVKEVRARLWFHGPHRIAYRWLVGDAYHGQVIDPAVWRWPGRWFWRMSQPKRAGVRVGFTAATGGLLVLWFSAPLAAELLILTVTSAALAWVCWLGVRRLLPHHRRWVRPLHGALIERHNLSHPPRIARDRSRVILRLSQDWAGDAKERQAIVEVITAKTGIEGAEASWRLAGPAPRLELAVAQPCPALVTLADVRPAIEAAKADELVWGLGKRSVVVKSSLSSDSPHLGLSMGSGAGKSIMIRAILAQMLYHGAIALIIDYKQISQHWARDLPNVAIVRHPFEIHAALMWLGEEVNRRNAVAFHGADLEGNVHSVVGPRLIIAGEELNAAMKALRIYWRQLRGSDRTLPERPPSLDALDLVNLMGRQVLMNMMYVGQRLSNKASGGDGDVRESIGVMALGRFKASTWKMLAEDHPMPRPTRKPGRFQVISDDVSEVQGIKLSAIEARQLALAGIVSPLPSGMPGAPRVAGGTGVAIPGPEQEMSYGTGPVVAPPRGLVTLSEAVEQGVVKRSLHAVRKASQRDPGFPQYKGLRSTARLYDAMDLITWDES